MIQSFAKFFGYSGLTFVFLWVLPKSTTFRMDQCNDYFKSYSIFEKIFIKLVRFNPVKLKVLKTLFIKTDSGLISILLNINEFTQLCFYFKKFDKQLLLEIQKGGYCFIDVGANIGFYSLVASRYFEKILAFEPSNENYCRLLEAVNCSEINNIQIFNCGLSSETKMAYLYLNNENSGGHSVEKKLGGWQAKALAESVYLKRLDEMAISFEAEMGLEFRSRILVKIDVEGHESEVLVGAKEFITNQRPDLFMEVSFDVANVHRLLKLLPLGYEIVNLEGSNDPAVVGENVLLSVVRQAM